MGIAVWIYIGSWAMTQWRLTFRLVFFIIHILFYFIYL